MQDLIAWKNREDRKPLILLGARQVGKTYILKEFGPTKRHFQECAKRTGGKNQPGMELCPFPTSQRE